MAGYVMPPLGPYQWYEVVSALRKDVKLGNAEDAIYWATVMIKFTEKWETAHKSLAKQLWISAAEDIDDPAVVARAFAVFQMAKEVPETEHLMYLIAQMCSARKYWEHDRGLEVDRMVQKALGDVEHPSRHRPIPPYALDRHTRRGWDLFRQTGQFDDRYSGTYLGRAKTAYMYLRDGVVDAESRVDARRDGSPDDGFVAYWSAIRELMGVAPDEGEPNDPCVVRKEKPPEPEPVRRPRYKDVDEPACLLDVEPGAP